MMILTRGKNRMLKSTLVAYYVQTIFLIGIWSSVLATNAITVLLTFLASVSGALTLLYFEPVECKKEAVLRSFVATMFGLFLGAVINRYFEITTTEYGLFVDFLCGLTGIFFLKGLVMFTKMDARMMWKAFFARLAGIKIAPIDITESPENKKINEKK